MISDVNNIIDAAIARYSEGMQKAANAVIRRVAPVIRELPTDGSAVGRLVRSSQTDAAAVKLGTIAREAIDTGETYGRLSRLLRDSIEPIDKAIREELGRPENDAVRAQKTVARERLNVTLTPQQLIDAIVPAALNALYLAVSENATAEATIQDIQQRLGQRIETIARNEAATVLQQYSRNLIEIYRGERGLVWVQYVGPSDEKNREFCAFRVGGYYHVEEVRAWANEEWEGKIPGTNSSNIFVLLGGYNCRHVLNYVTFQEVNQNDPAAVRRARSKNLI